MRGRRPPGRTLALTLRTATVVLAASFGAAGPSPSASADTATTPLSSYVVTSVPGFTVASSGPLSAHRFATYDPDPAATTAALGRLTVGGGFDAYLRTWTGTTAGTALGDVVVAFASPAQATAYVSAAQASLPQGTKLGPASLPGVPGARGVSYASPYSVAATATERVALFTVARTAVIIGASQPGAASTLVAGPMATLAVEQHRLLAASPYSTTPGAWWRDPAVGRSAVVLGVGALTLAAVVVWWARRRPRHHRTPRGLVQGVVPVPVMAGAAPGRPTTSGPADHGPVPAPGTPPGWLPDPTASGDRIRYWDGTAWTRYTAVPA